MVAVVTIATPGLGDRSYVVADGRAAIVVDPQRDIDRIQAVVDRLGVPVVLVLETHIHNDYVTGGLELARVTGADYAVAAAEAVDYPRRPVLAGDELSAGSMTVRTVATPGHTPHHLAYMLVEDGEPTMVFTGGSLLYGAVGRTDLAGAERTEELTRAQYRSVNRLLDELTGGVDVRPTHGFGSFCSSTPAPATDASTVERERRSNTAATAPTEDAFVREVRAGLTAYPRYYAHMGAINRAGPAPLDLSPAPEAEVAALRRRVEAGDWVIDLRLRRVFAAAHVAGTVNIEAGDSLATYLGWVVPWGAPITLLGETDDEVGEAQRDIARIGIDRPAGAASGGLEVYGRGAQVRSYAVAEFSDLADQREVTVLDVRRDDEWAEGHIADAVHVPLPDLVDRLGEVPQGELWVHCRTGFRAAIGSSLLARAGRSVVLVDDDFEAAAAAGLEIRR